MDWTAKDPEAGSLFLINRGSTDNTVQLVVHDRINGDYGAVLMGYTEALNLGGEFCSAARRATRWSSIPSRTQTAPPVLYTEHTWDATASRGGEGQVDVRWATPLGWVLVAVSDHKAGNVAAGWIVAEDLMHLGGQLCAEGRLAGASEE